MTHDRRGHNYTNITTATTTVVKSGEGILRRLIINSPVATGVVTIYDNTSATGAKIATILNPAGIAVNPVTVEYNVKFSTGLTIVTSAVDNITVVWN